MTVAIDTDFLVRLSILEHPKRDETCRVRDFHLDHGDRFAIAPQVLAEFVHVVTDAKRFEHPLSIQTALELSQNWRNAAEVDQIFPTNEAMEWFHDRMGRYRLGRKRILDTLLAATCVASRVNRLITGNPSDYKVFPELELIEI
jgi:predicted nucleic acid-binding protein